MSDPRDPDAAYIPADDALLRGYCGPVEMLGLHLRRPDEWVTTAYGNGGMANGADPKRLRLNPALASVRDHIARVMAEGMRCPACKGSRCQPSPVAFDPDDPCEACDGSGYLLPPAPIEHLLDRPSSRLTADESAACVAWSYRSWRVGGPVLRGVLGVPIRVLSGRCERAILTLADGDKHTPHWVVWDASVKGGRGWKCGYHCGPETGPEGRACADRAALAHNFALLNDDGSVTTPEPPTDRSPK